jgi:hypothetical protein
MGKPRGVPVEGWMSCASLAIPLGSPTPIARKQRHLGMDNLRKSVDAASWAQGQVVEVTGMTGTTQVVLALDRWQTFDALRCSVSGFPPTHRQATKEEGDRRGPPFFAEATVSTYPPISRVSRKSL